MFNLEDMTDAQQEIANEFSNMIEAEFELCVSNMKQANKAAAIEGGVYNACAEIDSIRKYWYHRLLCLIEVIELKNPRLAQELAAKYLNNE